MKIEDQVVSLELAREMKELGAEQDSIFWWVKHFKSGTNRNIWSLFYSRDENDLVNKYISAFTVAELGEMLPFNYTAIKHISMGIWFGVEFFMGGTAESIEINAKTEADVRAKVWLHLKKEGLL